MLSCGAAMTGAGVVAGIALGSSSAGWLVLLAAVGLALIAGSVVGARALGAARRLIVGPAQEMELSTWPYRSARAAGSNRVLVTLDRQGSVGRTPLAEFTASWFTPGSAEAPPRSALVYGSLARGTTALAVAADGSCFTGRVVRTRG